MKKTVAFISIVLIITSFGCKNENKNSSEGDYTYVEKSQKMSDALEKKIGSWAEQGSDCYGILALTDGQGMVQDGAVIKAKILMFKGDSVKMKSMVDIKLKEVEGCNKMGISKGQTWWETEGDIFRTEEEASEYLSTVLSGSIIE